MAYAQLLNDASEVPFKDASDDLTWDEGGLSHGDVLLTLPVVKPEVVVPVVELFLK